MPTFWSLVEVVVMMTSGAASDNEVGIIMILESYDDANFVVTGATGDCHIMTTSSAAIHHKVGVMTILESCDDANFVITGGTGGCLCDNLQCCQWPQSWHHNNLQGLVIIEYCVARSVDFFLSFSNFDSRPPKTESWHDANFLISCGTGD